MRELDAEYISGVVADMCVRANLTLSPAMQGRIAAAGEAERSPLGKKVLGQLMENMSIAEAESIPICQDTGMAVFFVKVGQDLHINGNLTAAINAGVRKGYKDGYLRKSVVGDPLIRVNTNDNTPAIIHYDIVPGDQLEIVVAPKGFGSENMSRIYMLKPADGMDGVRSAVMETVQAAGPNACPPFVVGVGIGGDFEMAAVLAKRALIREPGEASPLSHIARLEAELLSAINSLGIGPAGLGGAITALSVQIETYPTHIAGLPVAVNMCCHVNRHVRMIL